MTVSWKVKEREDKNEEEKDGEERKDNQRKFFDKSHRGEVCHFLTSSPPPMPPCNPSPQFLFGLFM